MMGRLPRAHKPLTRNCLLCAQSAVRFCDILQHWCEEALLPHVALCYIFVFCYWQRKSKVPSTLSYTPLYPMNVSHESHQ
jgi:hypothetical protein